MRASGSSAAAVWVALQLAAAALPGYASAQDGSNLTPSVDVTDRADAREAYSAGLAAFARSDYADAAREFTRAIGMSASPNAKLMLGRCLRQLRQLPEAYRVLQSIVRPGGTLEARYAKTRAAAEDELRVLRSQLGILTVYVRAKDTSALLHVNNQPIAPVEWNSPIGVQPGIVRISLETAPGEIQRREVEIVAGQRTSIVIGVPEDLDEAAASDAYTVKPIGAKGRRRSMARGEAVEAPAPELAPEAAHRSGPSGLRIASYMAVGTSAASFVAFGILGTLSATNYAKLEDGCPNERACDADLASIAARGHTQQILANIALAIGATTFAAGAAMFVMSEPPGKKERAPVPNARQRAARRTAVAITPAGVVLRGEL
jgi:hypothetical protein